MFKLSLRADRPAPPLPVPPVRPRLMFFGDPHGNFEPVIRTVLRDRPEAIVLLGDIEASQPLQIELAPIVDLTEVWWIPGNHDTDSVAAHDALWKSALGHQNLHGRVATIAGYRVGGLGGVFRKSVWDTTMLLLEANFLSPEELRRHMRPGERWRGGISLRHRSTIFPSEVLGLARHTADILVLHEGLGGVPHGHPILDLLAKAMEVSLVVHGHLHRFINYRREGRLAEWASFEAFGIDLASHLVWPHREHAHSLQPVVGTQP